MHLLNVQMLGMMFIRILMTTIQAEKKNLIVFDYAITDIMTTKRFRKFFWMAASQGQLQRYIYISYCDVMLKKNEF